MKVRFKILLIYSALFMAACTFPVWVIVWVLTGYNIANVLFELLFKEENKL